MHNYFIVVIQRWMQQLAFLKNTSKAATLNLNLHRKLKCCCIVSIFFYSGQHISQQLKLRRLINIFDSVLKKAAFLNVRKIEF